MAKRDRNGARRGGDGGPVFPSTPATAVARASGIEFRLHAYASDPRHPSYGDEAVKALGLPAVRVFKTLVVALGGDDRRLALAVVPVASKLSLKRLAAALGERSARLADVVRAERATGYVAGGISPLGQRSRLPLALDDSAFVHETIFVSAGRRGVEIELAPADLLSLATGVRAPLCSGS